MSFDVSSSAVAGYAGAGAGDAAGESLVAVLSASDPSSPNHDDRDREQYEVESSPSITSVADIIKSIDSAFAQANSSAITAAREAEEARQNARAASEVARLFLSSSSSSRASSGDSNNTKEPSQQQRTYAHDSFSYSSSYSSPPKRPIINPHYSSITSNGSTSSKKKNGSGEKRTNKQQRMNGSSPTTSSIERIAEEKAKEAVSLSLELDRVKQSLQSEQMAHDETKAALGQAKTRNEQLEAQIDRLLADMETQRETSGRNVDSLEQELAHARMCAQKNEEDAELALELAKENTQSREQVEELLQTALHEIHVLKEAAARKPPPPPPPPPLPPSGVSPSLRHHHQGAFSSSSKHVRFADSPTILSEPAAQQQTNAADTSLSTTGPSRSLISTGRQLLHRSLGGGSPERGGLAVQSGDRTRSMETVSELRQRLKEKREKFRELCVEVPTPSSLASSSSVTSSPLRRDFSPSSAAGGGASVDGAVHTAIKILKESGKRLALSGRWWNENPDEDVVSSPRRTTHLETLTRHYCTSVEVLVDRKQKEVIELESLCALWEQGSSSSPTTSDGSKIADAV